MKTKSRVRKILNRVHNGSHNGKSLLTKVNRTASHVTKDVNQYITKKPYQVMGVTLITGLCLGFLMHR
jgi:ElaB/YqjD/DUF883 family membrane-anchored ribosome-binding protein